MKQENDQKNQNPNQGRPAGPNVAADKSFEKMNAASSGGSGLFSRLSGRFNDALQSSRGPGTVADTPAPPPQRSAEDVSLMRARSTKTQKMFVPDGVIIEGSVTGGSETEIHGRIEGNVTVDGTLFLGKTALITGNVRAGSCQVEGMVDGKVECTDMLLVAASGRLNADAIAGKQVRIAGQIKGNAATPGSLRIEAGGIVNGDVKARVFSMDDGATLNGRCVMRAPSQK